MLVQSIAALNLSQRLSGTEPFVICKTEFSYMVQTVRVTVPADMLEFMCKLLREQQEEDSEHLFSEGLNGVMAFTANG